MMKREAAGKQIQALIRALRGKSVYLPILLIDQHAHELALCYIMVDLDTYGAGYGI